MSWLPAPKTLWGLVTSQESRDHVTPTLLNLNSLGIMKSRLALLCQFLVNFRERFS